MNSPHPSPSPNHLSKTVIAIFALAFCNLLLCIPKLRAEDKTDIRIPKVTITEALKLVEDFVNKTPDHKPRFFVSARYHFKITKEFQRTFGTKPYWEIEYEEIMPTPFSTGTYYVSMDK